MFKKGTAVIVLRDPDGVCPVNMIGKVHCTFESIEEETKGQVLYGVVFPKRFNDSLHNLRKKSKTATGWYFKEADIAVYKESKEFKAIEQEDAKQFFLLKSDFFKSKERNLTSELENSKRYEESNTRDIESYERNIEVKKSCREIYQRKIAILEEQIKKLDVHPERDFASQIAAIKKNKKIESIEFLEHKIRVFTKSLTYTHKDETLEDFELGKYVIQIDMTNLRYKIVNLSKRFQKNYHHPCVPSSLAPCLGSVMIDALQQYITEGDIAMMIFSLISYIEKPDYENPHKSAGLIQFAQDIDHTIYTIDEHLNGIYENIPWDEIKYLKDKEEWLKDRPDFVF